MNLLDRRCQPCRRGTPKLEPERVSELLAEVPGWEATGEKLRRTVTFKDFLQAMRFVNRMAEIAEAEGHHPDFRVHYNRVDITVWTHAIDGLSENDFILAAKIDSLLAP